jgi:hypothetical protein
VHTRAAKATRPVGGHRGGRRLLQRLVGEQPARRVADLGDGAPAQPHGLHQDDRARTESVSHRSDVAHQRAVAQLQVRDVPQRARAGLALQVLDVVERERYDGLTPVTITL